MHSGHAAVSQPQDGWPLPSALPLSQLKGESEATMVNPNLPLLLATILLAICN